MKVKVACIQLKGRDCHYRDKALDRAVEMVKDAAKSGNQLIILPEAIYPGYFLEGYIPDKVDLETPLKIFRNLSLELRVYIAVGLLEIEKDTLYNSAFLIGDDGLIIGKTRKGFLWHFDRCWFGKGGIPPVFETKLGKIGMIVCADGRHPDICRSLALNGAKLIIDCTNWVTTGTDPKNLSNPQVDYIMPARAIENNLWIAAANKTGLEGNSVIFCGNSTIIDPKGNHIARASSHQEEIISAEIEIEDNESNICPYDQRAKIGVARIEQPVVPSHLSLFMGFVTGIAPTQSVDIGRVIKSLDLQKADLIILPNIEHSEKSNISREIVKECRNLRGKVIVKVKDKVYMSFGSNLLKVYQKGSELNILELPFGNFGFIIDEEGEKPEIARALMKKGADCIIWLGKTTIEKYDMILRTRGAENRIFLAANLNIPGGQFSGLVNPMGQVIASGFKNTFHGFGCQADLVLSRCKEIVPSTDVREEIL